MSTDNTPSISFYRRPLPDTCIAFSSPEGKKLFNEALADGTMHMFFPLIEQFHTQNEPAYCGLGTLVNILNALQLDPNRLWKGPWRWFSEDLLDCCVPLEQVKTRGITIPEFVCLLRCNGGTAELLHYGSESTADDLRSALMKSNASNESGKNKSFVAVSYDRSVLEQTGTGHFSPIAGYHRGHDMVLILDVARFKYPPHWTSLELLHNATLNIDPDTGRSRGFMLVSKDLKRIFQCSVLFRTISTEQSWYDIVRDTMLNVSSLLDRLRAEAGHNLTARGIVEQIAHLLEDQVDSGVGTFFVELISKGENETSDPSFIITEEHRTVIEQLFFETSQTKLFKVLQSVHAGPEDNVLSDHINVSNTILTILIAGIPDFYLMDKLPNNELKAEFRSLVDECRQSHTRPQLAAEVQHIHVQLQELQDWVHKSTCSTKT